jgi:hypothetical protein
MARLALFLAIASVLLGGCVHVQETQRVCDEDAGGVCPHAKAKAPAQVLRHVVLFKFKDGTSAADVRKIENAFSALPSKIDAICDFEWGTDVSVEGRQKGFTHCFLVSFPSAEARAEYLPHPAHKEFGSILGPHLDDVIVIDYWAK